ncbi:hypothetical protein [Kistimonas asteriae]|uniref:hypothetical protein n=1 Tax=Kistimonas asteriae TaxID=517724 RepID=UPI001BAA8290|nr:hypothetical protein [Kistimonas asteriae]
MKHTRLNKTFIYLTFLSIMTFTNSVFADIKISNTGAYVIERICINDFDSKTCQKMSLPIGQSYTIPSENIPSGGTQIAIEVLCAAYMVLPMADAQGITANYIQDGEQIKLNGICTYFGADNFANVMPQSNTHMDWNIKFK